VARTVVDLARSSDFRRAVVVADSALRIGRTSDPELHTVLEACAGCRGIQLAKEVVAFADRLSESALESIARVVFRDCGLPPPELQAQIPCPGVIYRVDFFWRQLRTIGELTAR
jgi:hypothetical protein